MCDNRSIMGTKAHSENRGQARGRIEAHLESNIHKDWHIMNWSINRAPAIQYDFLCGIGRFVKSQGCQSFIGEKGRIISRAICIERIPGNLIRTGITGLQEH